MPTEGGVAVDELTERRCGGSQKDGAPCGIPEHLLIEDPDQPGTWMCFNHAPWPEDERAIARAKGGLRSTRKHANQPRFLDLHDLGPLQTPEDARRRAQITHDAVV